MHPEIYLDTYMLINFCLDFLALYITARVMKPVHKAWRLAVAALIGSVYSAVSVLTGSSVVPAILIHLAASAVICLVAFAPTGIVGFIKYAAVFYLVCFALGGGIQALYYLAANYGGGMGHIPTGLIFSLALASGSLSVFAGKLIKRGKLAPSAEVTVHLGDKKVTLRALVDSGNLAEDPLSGLPVLITSYEAVHSLLGEQAAKVLSDSSLHSFSTISPGSGAGVKVRLIPVHTLGGDEVLPAFIPDYIAIKESPSSRKRVIVGLQKQIRFAGGYDGILPASVIG